MPVPLLVVLAPLFLVFEAWQLVISERHLGIKQIKSGDDPREHSPTEPVAALWAGLLLLYYGWMLMMLVPGFGRAQTASMIVVTMLGYALRRSCGLKWVLVVLTIEGAIRIGMIISLLGMAWKRL